MEGGWNFQGDDNGLKITFHVSWELLQDIDPSMRMDEVAELFQAHEYRLQEIAREKVAQEGVPSGNPPIVYLTKADVNL